MTFKNKKEFNFMISGDLDSKLKDYCKQKNITCTKAVNRIIKIMLPLLKKHHFFSKENHCRYHKIEKAKRIHSYIDKKVYRELKLVHSNLNFYSIAILIRYLLKKFFELLEKREGKVKRVRIVMKKFNEELQKRCEGMNYEIFKSKKQLSQNSVIQIAYTQGSSINNIKILNPVFVFT